MQLVEIKNKYIYILLLLLINKNPVFKLNVFFGRPDRRLPIIK